MTWFKQMKLFKKILTIIVVFSAVYALVIYGLIRSEMNHIPDQGADTLIVLGAKVWGNEEDPQASPVLKERLDQAFIYLKDNPGTRVIVTGGQGSDEPESEAVVMRDYLILLGVSKERILVEDQSTSTKENLIFSQQFGELGRVVLVTSDYHTYRGLLMAKRLGFNDIEGLPAPSKSSAKAKDTLREVLALGFHLLYSN